MRTKKNRIFRRTFENLVLLVMVIFFSYVFYVCAYRSRVEPPPSMDKTDVRAACYTQEEQFEVLERFHELHHYAIEGKKSRFAGTYVVPGLRATLTLNTDDGLREDICSSMTPQGVALTEKYILVTAYCRTKTHNSVIYVIDRWRRGLIKVIVLPGKPHAGGIAYDAQRHQIWYSSHEEMAAAVCVSLEAIEKYDFEEEHVPINTKVYYLYGVIRDSFLTIHDNKLYVGYYNRLEEGTLACYNLDEMEDMLQMDLPVDLHYQAVFPEKTGTIPTCAQGIAFTADYMILSQSYGIGTSTVSFYQIRDDMWYNEASTKYRFHVPEMLEQICYFKGNIYMIFESAAYAYRASSMNTVDRILQLDYQKILDNM